MTTDNKQKYFSLAQVAGILGIHLNTASRLVRARKITAVKVANVWRISQAALDHYIESRTVNAQ